MVVVVGYAPRQARGGCDGAGGAERPLRAQGACAGGDTALDAIVPAGAPPIEWGGGTGTKWDVGRGERHVNTHWDVAYNASVPSARRQPRQADGDNVPARWAREL